MTEKQGSTPAVLYARFSPRIDADECESCAIQLAYCREYCDRKGYQWSDERTFYDNAKSGADRRRPGLEAAIQAMEDGGVLVCRWFNRIARDIRLAYEVEDRILGRGGRIESADGGKSIYEGMSPEDKYMVAIFRAHDVYIRESIAIRTSMGMQRNQRNGRRMTNIANIPYGWQSSPDDDARIIPCHDELRAAYISKELRNRGFNCSEIAKRLNKTRLRSWRYPDGWVRRAVYNLLYRMNLEESRGYPMAIAPRSES